ncbi:MAG: folate family ECF transporter S component, partial [Clostridium sp.]|nr:folate family ECF transporter S component [Clostridium sp.]
FSSLVNEFTCMLFGPVIGIIFGFITDILNYIVKPTGAFFPGFTLDAMIAGALYGILLYHKDITFMRVFIAKLIVTVIVNLGLATFWLCIMYGNSFMVIFPLRLIKNLIMLPINSILLYMIIKAFQKTPIYGRI